MIYYKKRESVYIYVHCTPHEVQTKSVQQRNTY